MPPSKSRRTLRLALSLAVVGATLAFAKHWYDGRGGELPPGFAQGNGRIEADQIDIATKQPARVVDVHVEEGDLVRPGDVLAVLDSAELRAQLAMVRAESARASLAVVEGRARVEQSALRTQHAEREYSRSKPLLASGAVSASGLERLETERDNAVVERQAADAQFNALEQAAVAAEAQVDVIQALIDDCTLRSPTFGRILYRISEPGEVVAAGGTLLTVLDLTDVYMETYLSATHAARLAIGADARIKLDSLPEFTIPATVVFVAPEAQFTPKHVETRVERESLMFRVKVRVPTELILAHINRVKTGVRGVAFLQVEADAEWPTTLEVRLPDEPPTDGLAPGDSIPATPQPASPSRGDATTETGSSKSVGALDR